VNFINKNKFKLSFLLFLLNMLACQSQSKNAKSLLTTDDFFAKINLEKNLQLIDVRTEGEFTRGHIKFAKNIDWFNANFISELNKLDKTKAVYLYCQSGGRSASALKKLQDLGFKEVYDLEGGFLAWQKSNKKSEIN
jgi:rhodanese-related sulfurtransferase